MEFHENLLHLRQKHNLSQEAVAKAVHIKLRSYQYYEHGERTPSLPTLIALADLYQITLDELVCRKLGP